MKTRFKDNEVYPHLFQMEGLPEASCWAPVWRIDDEWYGNMQRFATPEEALESARARFMRWTMPDLCGIAPTEGEPVTYRWDEEEGDVPLKEEQRS